MKRKFITNLALLLFLNLLIKPFWIFGIDRTVQNMVGPGEYGLYFALMNFSLLLNILLDFGITNYNNRNISQNNHLLSKHLSNIVGLKFLLGIAYLIICLVAALVLRYSYYQLYLLLFLVFNQFLISFIQYLRSNLAGMQYFKTDSFISVLDRSLMIIFCSFLLWGHLFSTPFRIEWFIYAQTTAYLTTAAITFFIVLSKTTFFKINFELSFFIAILKNSYPYALLILLMAFYNRIDSVMLERMLPDGEIQAGIYAQGYRVLDAASMISFLFAGLLLPMFSKMLKMHEPVGNLVKFSLVLLVIPAGLAGIASFIFRHEIMNLLYHSNTEESAAIFGVLMMGFTAVSTTYIFGTLLTANGSLRSLNMMACFGMIFNIVLNLILIPRYGALGSACTSMATQLLTACIQFWISLKVFKFHVDYQLLLKMMLFFIFIAIIGFTIYNVPIHWIYRLFLFLTIGMLSSLFMKLIKPGEMYHIIRYDK